ncbi:glycosyltransferase [Microcella frigidaquae]|uniref:Glycosyltransferase involved in cell wall biosynthesis n=1 Tax=Microcella frigidaquae TaxID=424758 RepID=A0A840XCJ1_9MICO|nr:glycosyltransferase involved in cell wall biosynthesis [Microcella frigidaquae]NHN44185.1 glycosyltransferase [Microcella frigidaquae]
MTASGVRLAMIVRNEEAIIERLITSVLPHIDSWRIIDTGSTDGTVARIEAALAGLPGELRVSEWVDFGHNRSELVAWATVGAEWLLLLDADMTIDADDDLGEQLAAVTADAALVPVGGGVSYRMPYLVRGGRPWHYAGRTHEYLTSSEPYTTTWFDGLRITHIADGSSHRVKLERDVELLGLDLLDNPDSARTVFYLAQTYRDAGEHQLALEHYQRRAAMGGWEEEVFWSLYQAALIEEKTASPTAGDAFIRAWDARPERAEPLYRLARRHRLLRQHHAAWLYASAAAALEHPADSLFVEAEIYRWGAAFERADAAWRLGHLDLARTEADRILALDGIPDEYRTHLAKIRHAVAPGDSLPTRAARD